MPKKRTDGRYELKVRISAPNEPRRYKAVYGSTLREAQEKKRKLEEEMSLGLDAVMNPTVEQVTTYWLNMKATRLRWQTLENYSYALKAVNEQAGEKKIRNINVDDARTLHAAISSRHTPLVADRAIQRMKSVCDDAIARGILTKNPFKYVNLSSHKTKDKRALTQAELDAFERADLTPIDRAFVSVLRYTGMRRGEALALNVSDVHFGENYIDITKTQSDKNIGPPKTKAGKRRVPMPDQLRTVLTDYIERYHPKDTPLLFPNTLGEYWMDSTVNAHWKAILKAAFGKTPPDITPHIFRHNYTSELVRNNIPITTAMLLLGHDNYNTTLKTYTHFGYNDIDTSQVLDIFKSSSKSSSIA